MQLSDEQLQEFNTALSSAKSYADLMGTDGVKIFGFRCVGVICFHLSYKYEVQKVL